MSYSLDDVRARTAERFAPFELDCDGTVVVLRSPMTLSDKEAAAFDAEMKKFEALSDDASVSDARDSMVSILAAVSDNPSSVRKSLGGLNVAELTTVMEMWQEHTGAPKSAGAA